MNRSHVDRRAESPARRRLAYATLAPGERCVVCHENPCVGHGWDDLLTGLVAAGVLTYSLGPRPLPPIDEGGGDRPYHLRSVA